MKYVICSWGKNMTITSFEAAKCICNLSEWTITNLQVHKLLYLAHMVYLGRNKNPLVDELFQAWMFGPVLPKVYNRFKIFGSSPVRKQIFNNLEFPKKKEFSILEETWRLLKDKKGWELVALTHREGGAWEKYFYPDLNSLIPNESIIEEYSMITNREK